MLTCKKAADLLFDFLENNLPTDVRQDMVAHLKDCPPCVQFVETYQKTTELCRAAMLNQPPEELSQRLMSFLRLHTQNR